MEALFSIFTNPSFWFGVLRSTTPILFAAMAALIAARAGITNMALEGIMLFGALFAVIGSWLTQSAWIGLLFSIGIAVLLSLLLAYFKIKMKADVILAALAINLLASGLTVFIMYLLTGEKSTSAALASKVLPVVHIPLIKDIPFIGEVVSGQNILVYLAFVAVGIMHFLLFKTPLGLRIRSVGGNFHAAESVGVSVHKTQYIALIISGINAGFAGAFMSMGYMTVFTRGMTAGRGYIALAASNVGGRAPIGSMLASILFGFFDSMGNNLQRFAIPPEFIYMIPYIATIVMFTVYSYRQKTEKQRKSAKLLKEEKQQGAA